MGRTEPTSTAERDAYRGFQRPPDGRRDSRWGLRGKTVWDWLQLLLVAEAERVQRVDGKGPIIELGGADLSDAVLGGADLSGTNLSDANLVSADLKEADLSGAVLDEASVNYADLSDANLRHTGLEGTYLVLADLSGANLTDTILSSTNLGSADLSGADLSGAIGITNEELDQEAESLEGATMPDGQKYEDWLNSNGSGEDGENE